MRGRLLLVLAAIAVVLGALIAVCAPRLFPARADTRAEALTALSDLQASAWPGDPAGHEAVDGPLERLTDAWRASQRTGHPFGDIRSRLLALQYGAADDPRHVQGVELLGELAPILEEASVIVRQPSCPASLEEPPSRDNAEWPVANGRTARARLLQSAIVGAMRRAAVSGDWPALERTTETGLLLAQRVARTPFFLGQRGAMHLSGLVLDEARRLTIELSIPPATRDELVRTIKATGDPSPPLETLLAGERIIAVRRLDFFFDTDGCELAWMGDMARQQESLWTAMMSLRAPTVRNRLMNTRSIFRPSRRAAERAIAAACEDVLAWASLPASERPREARLSPVALSHFGSSITVRMSQAEVHYRDAFRSRVAATIVALRLRAFRDEHSAFPETLDQAVPPDERIDPATGRPFEYRRLTGDPHGRPYTLRTSFSPWAGPVETPPEAGLRPFEDEQEFCVPRRTLEDVGFSVPLESGASVP